MKFWKKVAPHFKFYFFVVLYSTVKAYFEMNIEGAGGWARNLPTWRITNEWTQLIMGARPLTGYHCGLWMVEIVLLLSAFFVFGSKWRWRYLLLVASVWFWNGGIECYLWVVFNPHYGADKFDPQHVVWFRDWVEIGPLKFPSVFFGNWIPGLVLYLIYCWRAKKN
ncbi:MAG: hypothetical protein HQ508_00960 [Candidatus Marinimicrobia bacterium]|nr:hypothetical protein [Candidatus Neomarinimicrobiota bacterium]